MTDTTDNSSETPISAPKLPLYENPKFGFGISIVTVAAVIFMVVYMLLAIDNAGSRMDETDGRVIVLENQMAILEQKTVDLSSLPKADEGTYYQDLVDTLVSVIILMVMGSEGQLEDLLELGDLGIFLDPQPN